MENNIWRQFKGETGWQPVTTEDFIDHTEGSGYVKKGHALGMVQNGLTVETDFALYKVLDNLRVTFKRDTDTHAMTDTYKSFEIKFNGSCVGMIINRDDYWYFILYIYKTKLKEGENCKWRTFNPVSEKKFNSPEDVKTFVKRYAKTLVKKYPIFYMEPTF